ncbi:MAG TPA: hypothetical protein VN604_11835 [Nitrospirota bacterium]|nr:hypothetical protein [Nitrospirota bacterium]
MLFDLFTSLTTPCPPYIRALGYLDEAVAMRRRYRRNQEAWQSHLDNTRRFVLSTAEKCRDRSKAVILGSGLLLDVPLDELSKMFREVVLMDVVCLPEIRKRIKRYNNVSFIEHDATAIAERLSLNRQKKDHRLPEVTPVPDAGSGDAGLIVSLNVLSQLWVVPRTFVGQHLSTIAPEQVDEWCKQLVESHYAWLSSRSRDVCLVADFEQVKRDSTGSIISKSSTVYGLKLPDPDATWTWNIAPFGRQNPHSSKELTVGAWHVSYQKRPAHHGGMEKFEHAFNADRI